MKSKTPSFRSLTVGAMLLGSVFLSGCQTTNHGVDWPRLIDENEPQVMAWTSQSELLQSGVTTYPFYYDGETILDDTDSLKVWQDANFFYRSEGTFKTVAVFGINRSVGSWSILRGKSHKDHLLPLLADQLNELKGPDDSEMPEHWLAFLLESDESGRTLLALVNPEDHRIQGFLSL